MDLKIAAKALGAANFGYRDQLNKKYFVIIGQRMLHFGDSRYPDKR